MEVFKCRRYFGATDVRWGCTVSLCKWQYS